MKKKFPEWWAENRHFFEIASRLFFVPKKIKNVLRVLITTLDAYLLSTEETVFNKSFKGTEKNYMPRLNEIIVEEQPIV